MSKEEKFSEAYIFLVEISSGHTSPWVQSVAPLLYLRHLAQSCKLFTSSLALNSKNYMSSYKHQNQLDLV